MTIQAELHDGRILEFPDDTSQDIIQTTVKRTLASKTLQPGQPQPPQKQPTMGENIIENIKSGGKRTLENIGLVYPAAETAANLVTSAYGIPLSGLAGLASLINPGNTLEDAGKVIEGTQKALIYQPQTERGKELTGAVTYPMRKYEEGAEKIGDIIAENGNPDLAAGVRTAISAAPVLFGARAALKPTKSAQAIITEGISKAIRPSVSKKQTSSQVGSYYKKSHEAVSEIIKNKENLSFLDEETGAAKKGVLPSNLNEFAQSIEQTKKKIFQEYDSLAEQADSINPSIGIDLNKASSSLDSIINNKAVQLTQPETIKYALDRQETLKNSGKLSAAEGQEAVQLYNQTLDNFYKNRGNTTKGQAVVDALIANDFRKQLDSIIEKTTGKEYQKLKNKYGALKEIESDVVKRSIVDARKNTKGLIDFSDIFTGAEAVGAILTKNPAAAAKALTGKGISRYYKNLNDPNKIIKNMFSALENIQDPSLMNTGLMFKPAKEEQE